MKNSKTLAVLLAAILCAGMLTGCGHEHVWTAADCTTAKTCAECGETEGEPLGHTWADATCAAPQTCSVCGATEGEALPHTWADATCAAPKTCSVCGATEGEALPHTWVDANYQAPKTCSVCGTAEGEPLPAEFETAGLTFNITEIGAVYDYVTSCSEDTAIKTVGKLQVESHDVFESDAAHEALEGYEWHVVKVRIVFDDANAWEYGIKYRLFRAEDYYDLAETWGDIEIGAAAQYVVNFHGVDYAECLANVTSQTDGWINHTLTINLEFTYRLPVGYDGVIFGFHDAVKETDNLIGTAAADENILIGRLSDLW